MKYIHSDNLLVVGSSDGTIRIYDQSDQESNKSELLKVLSGGHKNQEVISLEVCKEMDIVMSGSVNGILSIWSIETG
jgi:WD40 repeat protein